MTAAPSPLTMKIAALSVLGLALAAGGCVRQGTYDGLGDANRQLTAQNQEQADKIKSLEAALEDMRRRGQRFDSSTTETSSTIQAMRDQLDALRKQLADADARFAGLSAGPLDQATDAALADLAARYGDLLSYDAAHGMLRFNSDLTFSSGSFEITSNASSTLNALSKILGELPSAQQYDVRVVGHTDSQPVRGTAARRFVNNTELSAFRAISVRNALVGDGIAANRVEFAGFGESRPMVANAANGNTPANRRVEIYLVRSTLGTGSPGMPAMPAMRRAAMTPPAPGGMRPMTAQPPAGAPARPSSMDDIMK
ncbi:hypothetical protein BH11PLA1_BH11PLA1_23830 [soil metagenome]